MEKEQKIEMRNLHWAYGDKTGLVPYIFNQDKTAIKLYSEEYNFDILRLDRYKTMPISNQLCLALNSYFQDDFRPASKISVYEQGFPLVKHIINNIIYGNDFDDIPFSIKEIAHMQKVFNRHMDRVRRREEKEVRAEKERNKQQSTIMDF